MWKLVLKLAVAVGRSEWAKRKAAEVAERLVDKALKKAKAVNDAVGAQ